MTGNEFLAFSINIVLVILTISLLLIIIRIMRGPTLPDRILSLDMLASIGIGYIAIIGIKTGYMLYLDIAISLGLVGFLATVALARFVLQQRQIRADNEDKEVTK